MNRLSHVPNRWVFRVWEGISSNNWWLFKSSNNDVRLWFWYRRHSWFSHKSNRWTMLDLLFWDYYYIDNPSCDHRIWPRSLAHIERAVIFPLGMRPICWSFFWQMIQVKNWRIVALISLLWCFGVCCLARDRAPLSKRHFVCFCLNSKIVNKLYHEPCVVDIYISTSNTCFVSTRLCHINQRHPAISPTSISFTTPWCDEHVDQEDTSYQNKLGLGLQRYIVCFLQ